MVFVTTRHGFAVWTVPSGKGEIQMRLTASRHGLWVAALLLLGAVPAFAQAPQGGAPATPPTRIRGTVESLKDNMLAVKSRDGQTVNIALAPNFVVRGVAKKSLADIKTGDYVASTSMKGTDGKLHAVEVHIFPEAMRGTAEGQFPWDLMPNSVMTNATVTGVAKAAKGDVLTVSYKGQTSEVEVGPEVPIVSYVPGDAGLLKPGAAVFVIAAKKPDGSFSAPAVTAEKDGVKPPM